MRRIQNSSSKFVPCRAFVDVLQDKRKPLSRSYFPIVKFCYVDVDFFDCFGFFNLKQTSFVRTPDLESRYRVLCV